MSPKPNHIQTQKSKLDLLFNSVAQYTPAKLIKNSGFQFRFHSNVILGDYNIIVVYFSFEISSLQ